MRSDDKRDAAPGEDDDAEPLDGASTSSIVVGGRRISVERGKKYVFIQPIPGNPNARPLTPAESRRHAELWQILDVMRGDPDQTPVAEARRVLDEIDEIASVSAFGGEVRRFLWMPLPGQGEPPDSEAVVIDLRN